MKISSVLISNCLDDISVCLSNMAKAGFLIFSLKSALLTTFLTLADGKSILLLAQSRKNLESHQLTKRI